MFFGPDLVGKSFMLSMARLLERNLHMVFIDLKKVNDKVPREIMVDIDEKGSSHQIY